MIASKIPHTRTQDPSELEGVPVAAIVHSYRDAADSLLADFAFTLRRQGMRVCGVVQQDLGIGKKSAVLVDLNDGRTIPLFQKLGSSSGSCNINSEGIAEASIILRQALEVRADLTVANRFGALEAAGSGFAAEMLALMSERRPLLTVVSDAYLNDWRHFTGGCGVELPPSLPALETWFSGVACRA